METRNLYSRDVHEKGRIDLKYFNTKDVVADALTKVLPPSQVKKLRELTGVRNLISTNANRVSNLFSAA